jgi:CheY-like chemotaxis protein
MTHSTIRLIVETTLKKKYEVTAKENGLEAYKWIDNEGNIPDLIICDIQMPEMDWHRKFRGATQRPVVCTKAFH